MINDYREKPRPQCDHRRILKRQITCSTRFGPIAYRRGKSSSYPEHQENTSRNYPDRGKY